MQLILVLETRSSCESDYKYIKSALDYFYGSRTFKISKIFATNKSELLKKDNRINYLIKKYNGESIVVICADYDRVDDPDNSKIINYCSSKKYDLVWMNLDVEEVFLGKQIKNKEKKKAADDFLKISSQVFKTIKTLNVENPLSTHPASNLLCVMNNHFKKQT